MFLPAGLMKMGFFTQIWDVRARGAGNAERNSAAFGRPARQCTEIAAPRKQSGLARICQNIAREATRIAQECRQFYRSQYKMADPLTIAKTNEILQKAEDEYARIKKEVGNNPAAVIECGDYRCTMADADKAIEYIRTFAAANNKLTRGEPKDFAKRLAMMHVLFRRNLGGLCAGVCISPAVAIGSGLALAGILLMICWIILGNRETFAMRPIRNFIYSPQIEHTEYGLVAEKLN
jgi:hypothetical protein